MLDFLSRVFGRDSTSSKNVAKERLRLVLVHDRANVSPELLTSLKNDLIKVISNYMEIDEKALEVSLDSSEDQVALVANIPVKRMKRSVRSPA
ncbi:Cell division topological specificity factor [Desulfotomaculum nigrificans CO-1-SRB]|uniref:Cell division topological specificity factor n=1 Tax=Desulfotomaculum nigrificans (strain DSM 14880 / VKM B-2319 / CO-1-SRB) TaxID=868595 RepID=F6B8M6_DESCC|nr:cell division topological specificity factor MinE [Desulfotomaculum nigrificans]AEF93598.1 Cell division topological specificity factor [Desulfotomaculum nigrificans CO-1-SRB]